MKLRASALILLFIAAMPRSFAEERPFQQVAFERMVTALRNDDFKEFVALADAQMQTMPKAEFDKATAKFGPLLKGDFSSNYVDSFRDQGFVIHYWKLQFSADKRDWLAKMAVADERVKGFVITRP